MSARPTNGAKITTPTRTAALVAHPGGRREAIVRAAIQLFVENGGHATSLEMVAGAAGVTRTAVYYYFPSKSDLIQEVIKRLDWDWWLDAIHRTREAPLLADRLRMLLHILITQSSESDENIYFALVKSARDDTEIRKSLRSQLQFLELSIREMVVECDDIRDVVNGRELDDVVEGVLGLVWSVASGVANTKNRTVLRQMAKAVDFLFPQHAPSPKRTRKPRK